MAKIQAGDPIDLVTMSKAEAKVGEVKSSMLDLATFNNENLGTWYLCDGQNSVVGTTYQTLTGEVIAPDMRGRVQRMKDHGASQDADGERTLGDNQDQATAKNGLGGSANTAGNHRHQTSSAANANDLNPGGYIAYTDDYYTGTKYTSYAGDHTHTLTLTGDAETRMKNTCVNFYVKVEY